MAKVEVEVEDKEVNLSDILSIPIEDAKRPKSAPQGTYVGMVVGHPRRDKSSRKGTDFSEYTVQLMEACDDVNDKDLEEFLDGEPLTRKSVRVTYYHTKGALYRLGEFLIALGIDKTKSIEEGIQEVPGKTAYFHIKHQPSLDGTGVYANVDRVLKL